MLYLHGYLLLLCKILGRPKVQIEWHLQLLQRIGCVLVDGQLGLIELYDSH